MKDRIKQYMDYKSISAGELSTLVGVQRSNISHILNGRNKPGASFIEKLLDCFPDLNARWLFTGKGNMIDTTGTDNSNSTIKQKSSLKTDNEIQSPEESTPTAIGIIDNDKPIERVVLLYKDGTFTDFSRK